MKKLYTKKIIFTLVLFSINLTGFSQTPYNNFPSCWMSIPTIAGTDNSNYNNKTILDIVESSGCDHHNSTCLYGNYTGYAELFSKAKINGFTTIEDTAYFDVNELYPYYNNSIRDSEVITINCYMENSVQRCDTFYYITKFVVLDKNKVLHTIAYDVNSVYDPGLGGFTYQTKKGLYIKSTTKTEANPNHSIITMDSVLSYNKFFELDSILQTSMPGNFPDYCVPFSDGTTLIRYFGKYLMLLDSNSNQVAQRVSIFNFNNNDYNIEPLYNPILLNDTIIIYGFEADRYDSTYIVKLDKNLQLLDLITVGANGYPPNFPYNFEPLINAYFDKHPAFNFLYDIENDSTGNTILSLYDASGNLTNTYQYETTDIQHTYSDFFSTPVITTDNKIVHLYFSTVPDDVYKDVILEIYDLNTKITKRATVAYDYDFGYDVATIGAQSFKCSKIDSFHNIIGFYNYMEYDNTSSISYMKSFAVNLNYINGVSGKAYADYDKNCTFNDGDSVLADILIELDFKGRKYYTHTDDSGRYYISPYDTGYGKIILHTDGQSAFTSACNDTVAIFIGDMMANPEVLFPMQEIISSNTPSLSKNNIQTKIYPNPANQQCIIEFNKTMPPKSSLYIYSLDGKQVMVLNTLSIQNTIPVETWQAGMYIFEVKQEQSVIYSGKFIVE